MRHVPGRLFSVGRHTVCTIPGVFSRNERVVCLFQGEAGRFAVVLVGAINVASIETVWAGEVTPPRGRHIGRVSYGPGAPRLERGAELGRFNMGSTAIVVFAPGLVQFDRRLRCGDRVLVRQAIGRLPGG
jgi:phosphatidylserine decarboxylase